MNSVSSSERLPLIKVSDHELMARYVEGETAAFTQLVRKYKDPLVNFVNRIVTDYDTAVDIVQETFIRVHRKSKTYEAKASFSTWLYRIATNLAINELRRRKRRRFISIDQPLYNNSESTEKLELPAKEDQPDVQTEKVELVKIVDTAINSLPQRYRLPLILRDIQGLAYEEVATILTLPRGTVKSRINRARNMLKQKLEPFMEV
jgi:RNA polymerase sigma-70 factor (ECF subfamily)